MAVVAAKQVDDDDEITMKLLIRASVHCMRGARKKLAQLHLDDGAALPLFS